MSIQRKPREFWIPPGVYHCGKAEGYIHVREILPDRENIKANASKAAFDIQDILLSETQSKLDCATRALEKAKDILADFCTQGNYDHYMDILERIEKGIVNG